MYGGMKLKTPSTFKVLDKGFVEIQKFCAEDLDVVNSARVSFNESSDELSERDKGLIRFLMREHHGTPFEHGFFKFKIKAPLFVFREWHRHRVGHSYNEWSGRYSELKDEFYVPDVFVRQTGKPGAYTFEEIPEYSDGSFQEQLEHQYSKMFLTYKSMLDWGIAKQQARIVLPLATYSEMIWSCNPRSLMHFLSLRNSSNAQYEIRCYAEVVEKIFIDCMPITAQAFIDFGRIVP